MHYDNPGLHGNVVDSSGLEILLTPHLRKYDSGLLTVGHDVTSFHIIPPGEERFTTVGHCPEICARVSNDRSSDTAYLIDMYYSFNLYGFWLR